MSKKSSAKKDGSTIKTLYHNTLTTINNGKKIIHEEYIIYGSKGLTIKFFHAEGDKKTKHIIRHEKDDKFILMSTVDAKKYPAETMTKTELLDKINKDKNMKFAVDFLKKMAGGRLPVKGSNGKWQTAGAKRSSRHKSKSKSRHRRKSSRSSRRSKSNSKSKSKSRHRRKSSSRKSKRRSRK